MKSDKNFANKNKRDLATFSNPNLTSPTTPTWPTKHDLPKPQTAKLRAKNLRDSEASRNKAFAAQLRTSEKQQHKTLKQTPRTLRSMRVIQMHSDDAKFMDFIYRLNPQRAARFIYDQTKSLLPKQKELN